MNYEENDSVSTSSVAASQVTSESILQDAFRNRDKPLERPKQSIQDLEELRSFQKNKRKEYEQQLNKNRLNFGQWLRYAKWEINHNHDFPRARSILERALDVNIQHIPFWVQYIQMELSHKNVNHALNLLDRATTTLPRVNKLWFLYVQTLETLKKYSMVRSVFERWLKWHPDDSAWDAYINFEKRYDEYENVRSIFNRYVSDHAYGKTWLKWLDFELQNDSGDTKSTETIRGVYERAVDTILADKTLRTDIDLTRIIASWADWEVSVKEYERARAIYIALLEQNENHRKIHLSAEQRNKIYDSFSNFEKTHGNKDSIESAVVSKRKLKYQKDLESDPYDINSWWSLIKLVQEENNIASLRSTFDRAVSKVPQQKYKSIHWRRYIILWLKYALWEELDNSEVELARNVWNNCLKVIPHKNFTFAKVWINFAEFELRNDAIDGLSKARKILGRGLGQSSSSGPKRKLFMYYIELEKKLGEWERVRKLYERWLEVSMISEHESISILLEYVEFEKSLNEIDRCISIFEVALDLSEKTEFSKRFTPLETLWISFIDFYKEEMKYDEARALYRQLLAKVDNTKVWNSLALFESSIPTASQLQEYNDSNEEEFEFSIEEEHRTNTRAVFSEAEKHYKTKDLKEERLLILEFWKSYEATHGDEESIASVQKKFPTVVKRRRNVDGVEEEFWDYIFPEDEVSIPKNAGLNKFLANAKKWALQAPTT
ncbi:cell cycle control protein [Scheffersomyces xylosifermentans]|uniref:cell cycle control protein n=1 Tax=Scheffersomyces xylosifermentans TaxID=1304137 RepID=UPI00315CA2DC